jgi:hypothetical protein
MRYFNLLGLVSLGLFLLVSTFPERACAGKRYGESLCGKEGFYCIKIQKNRKRRIKTEDGKYRKIGRYSVINLATNETTYMDKRPRWKSLWPDDREREIVRKLNRLNIRIRIGMIIAVPSDMTGKTYMDYAPFPDQIYTSGQKLITWDPAELAWAAYDENGRLVRWGPGVGGKDYCPDVKRSCRTVVGDDFKILYKAGANKRSDKYPVGGGGAPMPYYMPFYTSDYGFHGSPNVPGRHASHGCVRLFTPDAKWLNRKFAEKGTWVIVKPYAEQRQSVLSKKKK